MSSYKIVFKRTAEFTEEQWNSYTLSFNNIFKRNFSTDHFKTKYFNSALGYSFHGVLMFEGTIVGMFSAIPRKYIKSDVETIVALACDAFIQPEHRKDEMFLKQMSELVIEELQKLNILYLISIPNPTAYPYWKYFGGWKDISQLNYYVLPLRIGNVLGKLHLLNYFSYSIFKALIWCSNVFYKYSTPVKKPISLLRDNAFISERYSNDYTLHSFSDTSGCSYRIYYEEGVKTAYLIDCYPLTKKVITKSIVKIIKEVGTKIDIIVYVGRIEFLPFYFLKVPKKLEPRKQPFIGISLNEADNKMFYNISNWDINLASFDNR